MIFIRRPFDHQFQFPNKRHCSSKCYSADTAEPNVFFFRSIDREKAKSLPPKVGKSQEEHENKSPISVVHQGRNMQLSETKEHLYLSLDLPGVKMDDLQVQTLHGRLRIEAKRGSSKMSRDFVVDPLTADLSNLKADLTYGVLTIELPKRETPEPEDLTIVTEYPPEDISDKDLQLNIDLPGVKASDIKANYNGRVIDVKARRTRGHSVSAVNKQFPVDSGHFATSELRAYLADGVLTIHAPVRETPAPIKIPVSTSSPLQPATSTADESQQKEDEDNTAVHKETMDTESLDKSKDTKEKQPSGEEDIIVETVEETKDGKK